MTRPPMDHRIKRPAAYRTAAETEVGGYLRARFRAIRVEQNRVAREQADSAIEAAQKVRALDRASGVKRRSA